MVTDQDVLTTDETMLLSKGHTLSAVLIERLKGFEKAGLIGPEVAVLVEEEQVAEVQKAA